MGLLTIWLVRDIFTFEMRRPHNSLDMALEPLNWTLVPGPNPSFMGRAGVLATLEDRCFNASSAAPTIVTAVLAGSSGVGKTEVAKEFVNRHVQVE